jgi:Uma2 family endonuclease
MATAGTLHPMAEPANGSLTEDSLFEIVDGERVEVAMGAREIRLANLLAGLIRDSQAENPSGEPFVEMLFRLKPGSPRARRPDVAFVPYELWPERDIPEGEAWQVVPSLAVEIISPTNTAEKVLEKIEEYFAHGVRRVWLIYPKQRVIHVFKDSKTIQVLHADDTLEGGDLLPVFKVPVGELLPASKSS